MSARPFPTPAAAVAAALAVAAASAPARAQTRRVTARVTEQATGAPVPGASVVVVGTTVGGVTDERGVATIRIPAGPRTVRVRRIGYEQRTVALSGADTAFAVVLARDVLRLEAQVVTGAATSVSRRNAANDVAQVSAEQLTQVTAPSVENALAGRIAGAQIVQNSGAPGGGNQVRLRGITSVFGSADPLYVIDGVIVSNDVVQPGTNAVTAAARNAGAASNQDNGVNRIADLNPNDIESIDVLKGASAASIYGSKASNGVIIIRTKRGSQGRAQVDVLQRVGTRALMNTFGARRFTLDQARAAGAGVGLTQAQVDSNYASCNGFCDYERQLFGRRPLNYETSASVRGGTAGGTDYFASGNVLNDGGIQNNTGYQKQSGRVNLGQTVGTRLTLRLNANLIRTLTSRGISNNDNANITPYFVFAGTPSWFDLRPRNGVYPVNPFIGQGTNVFQNADFLRTPDEVYRALAGGQAAYNVYTSDRQTFDLRFDGGVDRTAQTSQVLSPSFLYFERAGGLPGTVVQNNANLLYYNANLNAVHSYTARGGPTRGLRATTSAALLREVSTNRFINVITRDLNPGTLSPGLGSSVNAFANRQATRGLAVFAQEELLMLDERLLLTAGGRSERSTTNGDNTRFYTFPKAAASYRWTRPFALVDELKPRLAWGQAGNLPLYIQRFSPAQPGVYAGQNTLQQGLSSGNPNIRPERQTEVEGGVDVAFAGSRAQLALTGYQKTINDVIYQVAAAPSLGYNVSILNGGSLRNRGVEASLSGTPVRTSRFAWNSTLNFARNVAVVTALPPGVSSFDVAFDASGQRVAFGAGYGIARLQVGRRATQIVGQAGTDSAGNTILRALGDAAPRFVLGFANDVTFGPVRVAALLDWQPGASNVNITQNVYDGGGLAPDRPDGGVGRARLNDQLGFSQYIQKASFAKLRELTLSYELPPGIARRALGGGARTLRLEVGGRNLLMWTRYPGVDPEVSNFGSQQISRFVDLAPFPPSRTFYVTLAGGL